MGTMSVHTYVCMCVLLKISIVILLKCKSSTGHKTQHRSTRAERRVNILLMILRSSSFRSASTFAHLPFYKHACIDIGYTYIYVCICMHVCMCEYNSLLCVHWHFAAHTYIHTYMHIWVEFCFSRTLLPLSMQPLKIYQTGWAKVTWDIYVRAYILD